MNLSCQYPIGRMLELRNESKLDRRTNFLCQYHMNVNDRSKYL